MLLLEDANVNAVDDTGKAALHYATNDEILKILLSAGANVNAVDAEKTTALHYASMREVIC